MNERHDAMRQLVEKAVSFGRKHQSAQTGYLHYCYHLPDEEHHLPIPAVENFMFILALLKSRSIDSINEAKALLDALLYFQNTCTESSERGNFPVYLHEYPRCKDRFTSIHAAFPVYWILKSFSNVLGQELKRRLEVAFLALLVHILNISQLPNLPYPISIKIAALLKSGGNVLQNTEIEQQGTRLLTELCQTSDRAAWYCPSALGIILPALAMAYPRVSESPWKEFWKHLEVTWHCRTCSYVGPAFKERQEGLEPQVTLYDLFLGYLSGGFSTRSMQENPVHLESVLIPPSEDAFNGVHSPLALQGEYGEVKWMLHHNVDMAYCYIEQGVSLNSITAKGFHPLRIVWGNHQRTHTFVCQDGNAKGVYISPAQDGIDLVFELNDSVDLEDREKSREIIFFTDVHHELDVLIEGCKATTFSFGETILMRSAGCALSLIMTIQKGTGRFCGHRMLGNRPSQLALKGKNKYSAYDWQIFMRTLQRSGSCILKAELRISR